MHRFRFFLLAVLLSAGPEAAAFEADVHVGLTQWLALKAGFDPLAAKTIAIGNGRVDSGDMQFIDPVYMYACIAKDDMGSRRAGEHHYPSSAERPAPVEARAVSPASSAARKASQEVLKVPSDQAAYRLFKLGEALHILQDSWSHQGVPDVPQPGDGPFACDATRAWGHPKARGGWSSHRADQTRFWRADTVAMAKASYEVLTQYPAIAGVKRTPRSWDDLLPALDGFVAASTKTEKKAWFVAQGMEDVSFLGETSLVDGAQPFERIWGERKLPPLTSAQSRQHNMSADVLDFYNRFFARWVSSSDFDATAAEFGPNVSPRAGELRVGIPRMKGRTELAAILKAWRLRDHGRVADIAHSLQPLSTRERATIDSAAKEPNAYVLNDPPSMAFFPLLPRGEGASPLLPFFVGMATAANGKNPAALAMAKFRHVPYDTVAVVAEKIGSRWQVVSIFAAVDH